MQNNYFLHKKIAIIGASYLQLPLIEKARELGMETHVFAWAANDVGEEAADYFYPISIVEKEEILKKCMEIGIDGIASIASDLASITVNYVAAHMHLIGNSLFCTEVSTNKHLMRQRFETFGVPSPMSILVSSVDEIDREKLPYPVIVKPLDRSGSRGITKVDCPEDLPGAISYALETGFIKSVLIEEFVTGREYSVECYSWKGNHTFLALTRKYTTGVPHFIETGHVEPADVSPEELAGIQSIVFAALDSLEITYGASHAELKIDDIGKIKMIEIGGRMGGDLIGSDLVRLSTGFDFVEAVLKIAMGYEPEPVTGKQKAAAIRFIFSQEDLAVLNHLKDTHPEFLIAESFDALSESEIHDSSERCGYFLMAADQNTSLFPYLNDLE